MMQSLINKYIQEGRNGTADLYSKIPYFLRTCLSTKIDSQPWAEVSEGCKQQDKTSLLQAATMYDSMLQSVDAYIQSSLETSHGADVNYSTLLILDKNKILNEFQNDAPRFVVEMARCLEREKQLISRYSEACRMQSGSNEDASNVPVIAEDTELKYIEDCTQEAENQLSHAKKLLENKTVALPVGMFVVEPAEEVNYMSSENEVLDEFRSYFSEIQSMELNYERQITQFQVCREVLCHLLKKALEALQKINHKCSLFLRKLCNEVDTWKAAEAKWSAKTGPETDRTSLTARFKRFGDVINTILSWFSNTGHLRVILKESHTSCPQDFGFSVDVGKLEQQFRAIISRLFQMILAAESFQSFHILSKEVELIAEKDLVQGSNVALTGRDGHSILNVESSGGNMQPDIHFNIEVRNFCRVDQNNVYRQFFRIHYKIRVSVRGIEYLLQTLSLPFTFNTGANQTLEHRGARMWYCASVLDLYSGFICPDSMSADDVIRILDNRVASMGKNTRQLSEAEKDFLKKALPVATDGTVTLQGFLKDKMKNHKKPDDFLGYSFYTWFYAVINSIEQLLLNAWQDGIIYGFCSDANAAEILMDPMIPEGTVLLRPSMSEVRKVNSTQATAALVMEFKQRREDAHAFDRHDREFYISSVPLLYKTIKRNSLYGAVRGIENSQGPVAKYLFSRDGRKQVNILKNYFQEPEELTFANYKICLSRLERFTIRLGSLSMTTTEEVSDGIDDSGLESSKRKRQFHRIQSTSSEHGQSSSQLPAYSGRMGTYFRQSSVPTCSTKSSMETKPVSCAVNGQGQRSQTQDKNVPGVVNVKALSGNVVQMKNCSPPLVLNNETAFGNVMVDVSKIYPAVDFSSCSNNENGQRLQEHMPNSSININMVGPGQIQAILEPYQQQQQYIEGLCGTSVNHFTSRSPVCSSGYCSSINTVPGQSVDSFILDYNYITCGSNSQSTLTSGDIINHP